MHDFSQLPSGLWWLELECVKTLNITACKNTYIMIEKKQGTVHPDLNMQ